MRAVLASLLLGACATAAVSPPPARLAGCWINRDAGVVTMRWHADAVRPNALRGSRLDYRRASPPARTRYSLEPSGEGFALCELDAEAGAATRCWQVAEGDGGSLEGGRAFIDRHGDRLRIAVLGAGPERVIFQGRRDGCD